MQIDILNYDQRDIIRSALYALIRESNESLSRETNSKYRKEFEDYNKSIHLLIRIVYRGNATIVVESEGTENQQEGASETASGPA